MNRNSTDDKLIKTLATRYATAMWVELGTRNLQRIDQVNNLSNKPGCESHRHTDPNVLLAQVFKDSLQIDVPSELPNLSLETRLLWDAVLDYTRAVGFCRLRGIRTETPAEEPLLALVGRDLQITPPGLPEIDDLPAPIVVGIDYYGRNPRLQVMHYDLNEEEPQVVVRYTQEGKVQEVLIADGVVTVTEDTRETSWDTDRDANPACRPGDLLLMPSGQFGEVMYLRTRYADNIEQFRDYDRCYGVLSRLDGHPASATRQQIYTSIEQAWDVNPLTVGTTDPTDFSVVPVSKEELPDVTTALRQATDDAQSPWVIIEWLRKQQGYPVHIDADGLQLVCDRTGSHLEIGGRTPASTARE